MDYTKGTGPYAMWLREIRLPNILADDVAKGQLNALEAWPAWNDTEWYKKHGSVSNYRWRLMAPLVYRAGRLFSKPAEETPPSFDLDA